MTDINIKKFLDSDKSICSACGRRFKETGAYTRIGKMVTGIEFGCDEGHAPHAIVVPLSGKEKFFENTLAFFGR